MQQQCSNATGRMQGSGSGEWQGRKSQVRTSRPRAGIATQDKGCCNSSKVRRILFQKFPKGELRKRCGKLVPAGRKQSGLSEKKLFGTIVGRDMTADAGLASDSSETDFGLQAVLGTYVRISIYISKVYSYR